MLCGRVVINTEGNSKQVVEVYALDLISLYWDVFSRNAPKNIADIITIYIINTGKRLALHI